MKYIRTFDGIFDITGKIVKETYPYYGFLKQNEVYIGCDYKQADTIEELLDEYVIISKDEEKPFIYDLNVPVDNPEFDSKDETVYGMI